MTTSQRRTNYFREWLSQFLPRPIPAASDEVVEKVRQALQDQPVTEVAVSRALKGARLTKYYEDAGAIAVYLDPTCKVLTMSEEDIERLTDEFKKMMKGFDVINPHGAFNHGYALFRLADQLNMTAIRDQVPLPTSEAKLDKYKKDWDSVYEYLAFDGTADLG